MKRPPDRDDLDDVLAACDTELTALLLLCAHADLRIREALRMTTFDLAGQTLTVHGKGGKIRRVPLGKSVREAVRAATPKPDAPLFLWTYSQAAYRMRKACA